MVEKSKTEKILAYLPSFLEKGEGNNYNFITSFDTDFQDVSDNIINLRKSIQLTTATGISLDDLGALFKLNRLAGESDVVYRARIQSFWQSNKGGGTKQNIIDSVYPALQLTESDIVLNEGFLTIDLEITIPEDFNFDLITPVVTIINDTKAAGIYFAGLDDVEYLSKDNKFLVNFSEVNGENTLL